MSKPKIAVHKFSSCDGCQLAFLNLGETLLELPKLVDIVHFAEAGPMDEDQPVDVSLVEGSINTAHDLERIQRIASALNSEMDLDRILNVIMDHVVELAQAEGRVDRRQVRLRCESPVDSVARP